MKKLRVLLVHGTWSSSHGWTLPGSLFQTQLPEKLKGLYGEVRTTDCVEWDGKHRVRSRSEVSKEVAKRLEEFHRDFKESQDDWDYLIIGHSHGGNIAVGGVRRFLSIHPDFPILGVVCLNTPFLSNELRATSRYLIAWIVVSLVLAFGLGITECAGVCGFENVPHVSYWLVVLAIALGILMQWGERLRRERRKEREEGVKHMHPGTETRPDVLCLASPDEEALTLLGLGEGIANLPQLMLHPWALVLALSLGVTRILAGTQILCRGDIYCWNQVFYTVARRFAQWITSAIAGGFVGSLIITLLFGLPLISALSIMVKRVLVSYVPLRPANSYFMSISDLSFSWKNPMQLLHSRIYWSKETFTEICTWVRSRSAFRDRSRGLNLKSEEFSKISSSLHPEKRSAGYLNSDPS